MSKSVLIALAALFSFGCASKSFDKNKMASINDIGVIAIFDDQMPISYVGTTVLSNKDFSADVSKWSINQTLVNSARAELGQMNKKTFTITLDNQFVQQAKTQAKSLKDIYLGNRYQELQQYVLAQGEKQGAQYVFVMHPMSHDNFPQYKPGFGLFCRAPLAAKGDLEVYSLIRAEIWNVKTKEVEARALITPADAAFKTGKTCEEAQQMAPEKLAALYKEQVMAIVKRSVDIILSKTL